MQQASPAQDARVGVRPVPADFVYLHALGAGLEGPCRCASAVWHTIPALLVRIYAENPQQREYVQVVIAICCTRHRHVVKNMHSCHLPTVVLKRSYATCTLKLGRYQIEFASMPAFGWRG